MKFEKGISGNPEGRPKGAVNKSKAKLKDFFRLLLDENQDQIREDLQSLEPKDRLTIQMKMVEFVEPKMRSTEHKPEFDISQLTQEQLDQILEATKDPFRSLSTFEKIKCNISPEYWVDQKDWTGTNKIEWIETPNEGE